ncbi:MAG TPA: hypothetical protein VK689_16495, partial [Armatimonadota bacterium]|nr:hypothetical protein [Armatimonadota bacterium]
ETGCARSPMNLSSTAVTQGIAIYEVAVNHPDDLCLSCRYWNDGMVRGLIPGLLCSVQRVVKKIRVPKKF